MSREKLQKTLADYLAIGVTPILIMLFVGSLVFFLQELFYDGQQYESRSRWILFWFVIGSVLTARIAVESGRAHASVFTAGLCIAVALAIFKFVPVNPWVPIVGLGIIWWCTDKLTWDCTLIDDSEDASGEGLLQVAGVSEVAELAGENSEPSGKTGGEFDSPKKNDPTTPGPDSEKRIPFWKRLFLNASEREGRPHSPGLWVVYFSLAALPIFGFGQAAISSTDTESRDFAFRCLVVYVGAGLGLLMLTSFLGLRRYLRQRNLQMPSAMALTWVGFGTMIGFGILVTCLLLPRPDGAYNIAELIDSASESVQKASDLAFLDDDGSGKGEGERSGEADENAEEGGVQNQDPNQEGKPGGQQGDNPDAQPGDQKGENGKPESGDDADKQGGEENKQPGPGDQQGGNKKQGGEDKKQQDGQEGKQKQPANDEPKEKTDNKSNQKSAGNKSKPKSDQEPGNQNQDSKKPKDQAAQNANKNKRDEKNDGDAKKDADEREKDEPKDAEAESTPPPPSSKMRSVFDSIGTLFKFIVYGILICVGLFLLWKNWAAVCNFLSRLWNELLSLFGRSPKARADNAEADDEEPVAPPRPFSAFANPFRTGAAQNASPSELVRYTFEALQAWAFENNCGRSPSQTPMEFGQRLQNRKLSFAAEANEVSQLYARVAYASHRPTASNIQLLEQFWRKLQA